MRNPWTMHILRDTTQGVQGFAFGLADPVVELPRRPTLVGRGHVLLEFRALGPQADEFQLAIESCHLGRVVLDLRPGEVDVAAAQLFAPRSNSTDAWWRRATTTSMESTAASGTYRSERHALAHIDGILRSRGGATDSGGNHLRAELPRHAGCVVTV